MYKYTDPIGHEILLPEQPKRIISLVPSQTELLFDLGLEEFIVGLTHFCIHPKEKTKFKTKIGGTKTINIERIKQLNPDLILANKEENTKEAIELLSAQFPVWTSDIHHLDDALAMIKAVGELTWKTNEANIICNDIRNTFNLLKRCPPLNTLYLIWKEPWMSVGKDTFIHDMLQRLGLRNCCENMNRYPILSIAEMQQTDAELILLSSEPYPFKDKHIKELQEHFPKAEILLCDGEMFSWYGSRLVHFKNTF